jgi:general secretion pathway protein K
MIGPLIPCSESKAKWRDTTGSALVVVLLLLAMVAVLTAVVGRSVSGAAIEVAAARNTLLTDSDLRAGVELGAGAILKLGDDMRIADVEAPLADRRVTVHITNERGRIDLNKAPSTVLKSMFEAGGIEPAEATTLATALLDWRGGAASQNPAPPVASGAPGVGAHLPGLTSGDTSVEFGGAAAPQQMIGTRYLFHPVQLGSIRGFTPKVVNSILPVVTVANGSAQIDPFVAAAGVIEAMPEMSASKVEGFIEARTGNTSRSMALLQLGLDKTYVTDTAAVGWRLEITITDRFSHRHRHEVVIVLAPDGKKPYSVLYASEELNGNS